MRADGCRAVLFPDAAAARLPSLPNLFQQLVRCFVCVQPLTACFDHAARSFANECKQTRDQSICTSGRCSCCSCCAVPAASCSCSAHSSSRCMTACIEVTAIHTNWAPDGMSKTEHHPAAQPAAVHAQGPGTEQTLLHVQARPADLQQLILCRVFGSHELRLEGSAACKPQCQAAVHRRRRHRRRAGGIAAADAAAAHG